MHRGIVSIACVVAVAAVAPAPHRDAAWPPAARGSGGTSAARSPVAPFRRPLPFFYDLYTFRGEGSSTAVVGAFAVPAGRLSREREDDEVRYRFDVTLVLSDTARRSVSRTDDSVFVGLPRPLVGEHFLYTHVELLAPPSRSTLHRVVMVDATRPGIGQLYTSEFAVPDYTGRHLMLSDVALAHPDDEGGWRRGDVALALLPTSLFPGSSFEVYYEIYNLPAGHRYETEISIEAVDASGRPRGNGAPVRTRFSGEAAVGADGGVSELRHLAAALERGRYRLTVTIVDRDSGEVATQSRTFRVRGWDREATLVRALPWKDRRGEPRG